jgi:hypothetical protein
MSLERKDVRTKLDAELHAALKVFARLDGFTEAEWVERVLVPEIRRRIGDATVAAAELARLGISGSLREDLGTFGKGRR